MSTTATPRQIAFLKTLLLERATVLGFDPADIDAVVAAQTADLTVRGASEAIDRLKGIRPAAAPLSPERQEAIDILVAHVGSLTARDASFGRSLVRQWTDSGRLSDKQWPYAISLAAKLAAAAERVARETVLTTPTVALAERVGTTRGSVIRVVVPGDVMGTDGTTDPAYVVSVDPSRPGVQRESGSVGTTRLSDLASTAAVRVLEHLLALDHEGLQQAQAAYGRAFGRCGRCGSPLSTDESKAMGLGPDCARM